MLILWRETLFTGEKAAGSDTENSWKSSKLNAT